MMTHQSMTMMKPFCLLLLCFIFGSIIYYLVLLPPKHKKLNQKYYYIDNQQIIIEKNHKNNNKNNNEWGGGGARRRRRRRFLLEDEVDTTTKTTTTMTTTTTMKECNDFLWDDEYGDKDNSPSSSKDMDHENNNDDVDGDDGDGSTNIMIEKKTIIKQQQQRNPPISRCNVKKLNEYCSMWQDSGTACTCQDPTIPDQMHNTNGNPRIGTRWESTFTKQKQRVTDYLLQLQQQQLQQDNNNIINNIDVVFVGDSITEHWAGESLGEPNPDLDGIHNVFKELFTRDGGGKVNGFVSAISGERTWNVLYRLRHNALNGNTNNDNDDDDVKKLDPKVFWLLIGTNDFGGHCCSVRNVYLGNIAIVEELRSLRPNSTIVINSILPRGQFWDHDIINPLNQQLRCYAQSTDGVEFFNATSIFSPFSPTHLTTIHYVDGIHPDEIGHRIWGEAILKKVLELI